MSRRIRVCWLSSLLLFSLAPAPLPARSARWVEVRSPNFIVVASAGEKQGRRVAESFEQFRAVFQKTMPALKVDLGQPLVILAVSGEGGLKELLPAYWERKGAMRPAGIYVGGQDKSYVALRTDAGGENPHHIVYHEYVHALLRLNFQSLPAWLNEGLAEFFAHSQLVGSEMALGQPSLSHLRLLSQSPLLPLELLVTVSHNSPYYSERNKASIFYAQSWAVVHYFMIGERGIHSDRLSTYLHLVREGVDDRQAAIRAFGDLRQLQQQIDGYIRQSSYFYSRVKGVERFSQKDFAARELSAAESASVVGDFHVHMQRPVEARARLEEAMRLDPALAAPFESMGLLHQREGDLDAATKAFARAVEFDSRSYLAHYYQAYAASHEPGVEESSLLAERGFRRAIELNPGFAPAYSALAGVLVSRADRHGEALLMARKAVELEPGNLSYHLNLGHVLLAMERVDEARLIGERVLSAARAAVDRDAAASFLDQVERHRHYLALRKEYQQRPAFEIAERSEGTRELQPATAGRENPAPEAPPTVPETPPGASPGKELRAWTEGRILAIKCDGAALDVTVSHGGWLIELHADNYFRIEYATTNWKAPEEFNPCLHLRDRAVRILYRIVTDKPYGGVIVSIEVTG